MAFFKKLKDRLFKSSSKLEEGLDAIVEDGGTEEEVDLAQAPDPDTPPAPDPAPDPKPDVTPTPEPTPVPEPDTPDPTPEPTPVPEPDTPDPAPTPEETPEPDLPDPAPEPTPAPDRSPTPDPEPTGVPAPDPTPAQPPEPGPGITPPSDPRPAEAPVEAPPPQPSPAMPETPVQPAIPPRMRGDDTAEAEAGAKPGLFGRLLGRGEKAKVVRRALDDDMLEQLEELLITADMGVDTALRVTANMAEGRMGKRLSTDEIKELLSAEIARIMEPVARPMPLYSRKPQVVLVVGVNGSGKTTTIGKLAAQFKAAGKSVVIAAGDTFRAAAVEQLQIWGDRAGVPVMTAPEGSDPASLAFDAMDRAEREGADLLMIDTAGRLQNRADLMEELAKIVRVIRKKDETAPHNTLLVLDATTGQNALSQVETFRKLADVSGLVMTKLDGTARGGVLVALADKFGLPIHAIGVGEQIDDLAPFDPQDFAKALTGA
ncbi:signal recognition particle-docking protein FtsY [Roseovarius sp. SCSIO 43702]|uniref:signal recognition particle-docking protein FtsY n=1 Tax=Roseovarius sp. SCSIO 43702 TaxID=2823043 RepID=UPI001C72BCAF|nr:signal recognition particle-docking protein FtsY [Roseovarius sp. SCSIO 43702]QYX57225.1 signal recognition particle-docking protein FtsY [Roseovarius sp. SCSIO 43702]